MSEEEKEKRLAEWKATDPKGLGPYEVVLGTDVLVGYPTSFTNLDDRVIYVGPQEGPEKDVALAHEIAHSRLLSLDTEDREFTGEAADWAELEAVLYTIAKGQPTTYDMLILTLRDLSRTFGDGSLKDAKYIARKVLQRLYTRGHITEMERHRGLEVVKGVTKRLLKKYGWF